MNVNAGGGDPMKMPIRALRMIGQSVGRFGDQVMRPL
jgi:hypothetical protein